jgi:hypothetical protein
MKLERYKINFNSEDSIEFLIDTYANSPKDIQDVLNEFMETEQYISNLWDSEDVWDLLDEANICYYPITSLAITKEFELPQINND